jgi:hypothetical protein
MTQSNFDDPGNDPYAEAMRKTVSQFLETLTDRVGSEATAEVIEADRTLDGTILGQEPERFLDDEFVCPVAESVLGYDYRPQPRGIEGLGDYTPDFQILNASVPAYGEIKTANKIQSGAQQLRGYLDDVGHRPVIGVATDGLSWVLFSVTEGERVRRRRQIDLRPVFRKVGRSVRHERHSPSKRKLRKSVHDFVSTLHVDEL